MEVGSEQCKEPDDERRLLVVCRGIEICLFDGKLGRFLLRRTEWMIMDQGGLNVIGEQKRWDNDSG